MASPTVDTAPDATSNREIHAQLGRKYSAGFVTDIESDSLPPGLKLVIREKVVVLAVDLPRASWPRRGGNAQT